MHVALLRTMSVLLTVRLSAWGGRPAMVMVVSAGCHVSVAGAHRISMACQWAGLEKLFATLVLHAWMLWVHAARMCAGHEKRLAQIASLLSFLSGLRSLIKRVLLSF